MRVRGHVGGVKEYLERGQRQGRDFDRGEMDERVILAGDLDISNQIIEAMETDAERYLTITLSFREDDVDERVLRDIVKDFERFAFSAFRPEEYCFYAEAHLPRIKAYANRKTGERIVRKPHIHIVIPKVNLANGQKLDPFAMVKHQERFVDAFQEDINNRYGLASPKAHRRGELTDASEMISRYKADVFDGNHRELKLGILQQVIDRGISSYADFQGLLDSLGERRTRNEGRENEYQNIKVQGAARGVNLKEYVFSRDFMELNGPEKATVLAGKIEESYETAQAARQSPQVIGAALREWHETRAREVKYFNGGNLKAYPFYAGASADERRRILDDREERFYRRMDADLARPAGRPPATDGVWGDPLHAYGGGEDEHAYGGRGGTSVTGRGDAAGQSGVHRGLENGFEHEFDFENGIYERPHGDLKYERVTGRPDGIGGERGDGVGTAAVDDWARERGIASSAAPSRPRGRPGAHWRVGRDRIGGGFDRQFDPDGVAGRAAAGSTYGVRGVSGSGLDGDGRGRGVELLPDHAHGYVEDVGTELAGELRRPGNSYRADAGAGDILTIDAGFIDTVDAYYAAFDSADLQERDRLIAETARKFDVRGFGLKGQRGSFRDPFERRSFRDYRDIPRIEDIPVTRPVGRPARRASGRARTSTGRESDSVRDQIARDLAERRRSTDNIKLTEFQRIKLELDAARLIAALSHSHGLIPEKYIITKGRDGGDRIQCGTRNLNVSDFLTREMHLSWADAAKILRQTFAAQRGDEKPHNHARSPERGLWIEFQRYRERGLEHERAIWGAQRDSERVRRFELKKQFYDARGRIEGDASLTHAGRRAAISLARMSKVEREAALKRAVAAERDALRVVRRPPIGEQYREFLREHAADGDARALRELRRIQLREPAPVPSVGIIRGRDVSPATYGLFYRGPVITHSVERDGVVTYQRDGVGFMSDEGRSVRVWTAQDDAIEAALRLSVAKFGVTVTLSGPEPFQRAAARVAADRDLYVRFDREDLNEVMDERREEIELERSAQRRVLLEKVEHRIQEERDALRRSLERDGESPGGPERRPDDLGTERGEPEPDR